MGARAAELIAAGLMCGAVTTFALQQIVCATGEAGSVLDVRWPACVVPALIVVLVGVLATWIPARHGLKIDPATLLRTG